MRQTIEDEIPTGQAAKAAADKVVSSIIKDALAGAGGGNSARVTKAPAGAGKTQTVLEMVKALRKKDARVAVVTQTNEQAFDLLRRLARKSSGMTISFMPRGGLELPDDLQDRSQYPGITTIEAKDVRRASTVVATADKWAYSRKDLAENAFDAGIIDEA